MIIGLAGAAGAGKGSVAAAIRRLTGWKELGFADPVYGAVAAITGLTIDELHDRNIKEKTILWIGKSPRELLQLLGTEWGRNTIKPTIWIERALALAGENAVITDLRFDNEAQAIHERGGVVWRVLRPSHSCLSRSAAEHSSEAGVSPDLIDLDIWNDGTLGDLEARVNAAMKTLRADTIR